jgi:hypothetical protein
VLVALVRLLPDVVVTMQALLFDTRSNVQCRCRREDGISGKLRAILEIVWFRDRAQEMIDDFQQV